MKKSIFFILFVPIVCWGQSPSYDTIIGDTVIIGSGAYHREFPQDTVSFSDSFYFTEHYDDFIIGRDGFTAGKGVIKQISLPSGTIIYGVAVVGYYSVLDSIWPTYAILTKEGNNYTLLDSANFDSYRVISAYNYGQDSHGNTDPRYSFEYYFDNPVYVSGDIYIGLLNTIVNCKAGEGSWEYSKHYTIATLAEALNIGNIVAGIWYRLSSYGNWIRDYSLDRCFGGFFPIVEPDRLLCGRVENFRLEERGEDFARLAWHPSRPFRDLYSGTFQVALGGLGPQPDTSNILTFSDTLATLTGLDSGVWYSTWVRGECCHCGCPMHGDTLIWGPWRGPLQFYLGSRQPGIQEIEAMDPNEIFSLSPNPANKWLTATFGETLHDASLQIINMEGQVVDERGISGAQAILDISALQAGIYLLRLCTVKGTATRKLVVE